MRKTFLACLAVILGVTGCSTVSVSNGASEDGGPPVDSTVCANEEIAVGEDGSTVADIVQQAVDGSGLTSALYRVTRGDEVIATGAIGDSIHGVPAELDMHFRNGNVAFAYMGTLLLLMAEDGTLTLDDTISQWLPDLDVPRADEVTLKMLVQNTSGYPDYVRDPAFGERFLQNPFQQFDADDLLDYAFTTPPLYEPGTAWNYAHTSYVILGEVLAAAGGQPLADLLTERVITPMGLASTTPVLTSAVPEPVLHSFSSEREVFEDTTYWNPSWQTAPGSVVATNICDLAESAQAIGTGSLLSDASFDAMIAPETAELPAPPASCTACRQFTEDQYYGMGVIVRAGWIHQTPLFAGTGVVHAYLPPEDLTVAVVAVSGKESDSTQNHAIEIWTSIAAELSPDHVPPAG
ncbi:serine hydrolase domain-containing protein [Gulosibacter molinativorax]|uniref:Beta-lactamase-related domain-containing protein n=1 Tax=Gulosibacter molinativorax TaxID=256821 RepID=A0ABT7CC37_9MICO|nr:serine hydrolase domain-containing protein [Gulosibacter molinativorax]MDJ1372722.1 hypothetical protein [Gulosibacter molinativorax]QUY62284.1 Lipoprotein LpqK [Gulosibacter molinativorax]